MADYSAIVVPNQPWDQDGTALVTPSPPFPDLVPRVLPLEHRVVDADLTIRRADYPQGVVIIPQGSKASGPSATFPLLNGAGDEITYEFPGFQALPDGIVFRFRS